MRYWPKGCDRCGGDVFEAWDIREGFYLSCIQCGHTPRVSETTVPAGVDRSGRQADEAVASPGR